jgi:hypothetical protein
MNQRVIRVAGHLKRQNLPDQRHERSRIISRLRDQVFNAASLIERLNDHLFNGGLDLVGRALGPSPAGGWRIFFH